LLLPIWSNAAVRSETFKLSGSGGYAISPAEFNATVYSGTLFPGTFNIEIDDVTWPTDNPGTPENERWNYIFTHYFTYNSSTPGAESWTAYFPPQGEQVPVVTFRYQDGADRIGGILLRLQITIRDSNANHVVDQAELVTQAVAGNLVAHVEQGAGFYQGWCGQGSMNGTMDGADGIGQPYSITISTGNLLMRNTSCAVPVENTTWGAVKQIYSD